MRNFLPLALLAVSAALAADAPTSSGRLVHIDLVATNARGGAVEDLAPSDFELIEEGVSKPIEAGRFVRASAGGGPRAFAIFLDEYHVSAELNGRVRDALSRFVEREIAPEDLLTVMRPLDSLFAIELTKDRDAAGRQIREFDGRKGQYEPRNAYERNFIAGTPARIDAARTQVAWSAINALAAHLGNTGDGRKTLIVVTEGVAATDRRRGQEYLATRDTVLRTANRANVAIYMIDPGEPSGDDADGAAVRGLTAETDGAFVTGDLDAGLRRAAIDAGAYYLLSYRSTRPDDGRFHEVQVRSKRAGVTLRARKGFVAASPDEVFRAALLAKMKEPKVPVPLEPALHVSTLIRPWFGLSRGADGKTRVTFVWEPASRVPGERGHALGPARLQLTALGSEGGVLFEGPVRPTGPATIDEPGAPASRAVFEVKPGRLRVRMSIQDATTRQLDLDVRDLAIRDLKGDVALGTPEVLRARNAREFRELDAAAGAVPVATREFSRTERLLIRFQAWGPAGAPPALSARLVNRSGQSMRELTIMTTPSGAHTIDLPLAGLAAGTYAIEFTAAASGATAKDRLEFRVTS